MTQDFERDLHAINRLVALVHQHRQQDPRLPIEAQLPPAAMPQRQGEGGEAPLRHQA